MPRCGLVEKGKPACTHDLDAEGMCPVHCRANTSHGPCKKRHKQGRRRCFKHGGSSRKGISHPNYKTGERVRERYKAVLSDPEMREAFEESELYPDKLSLRAEIDLLDSIVALRLKRLQRGEGPAQWRQAQGAFEEFAAAQAKKDRDASLDALQRLAQVLRRGVADERDMAKVEELAFERRPKLVEAEDKAQYFRAEVVHILMVDRLLQLVASVIKQHVKDPSTLAQIETALLRVVDDAAGSLSAPRRVGRGRGR